MQKKFLTFLFSITTMVVFAQKLENPTMNAPFTESSGNFLVLTLFDKIGKSEITIDYVKSLRQELNDSKKLINEQKKEVDEIKRLVAVLQRQLDEQNNKIEELQRKVK